MENNHRNCFCCGLFALWSEWINYSSRTDRGELAKKQIALDFEGTQKNLLPLASRAINAHGAFRLANSKSSRYGIAILSKGDRQVELSISSGKPRKVVQRILQDGKNVKDAVLTALDKMVASISGQPGFLTDDLPIYPPFWQKRKFSFGRLMSTASPQTAFGKITFNPSWDNTGTGIFFTSNRKIFNNIYHLNLASRKIRPLPITEAVILERSRTLVLPKLP